jgi:hypothetical protein
MVALTVFGVVLFVAALRPRPALALRKKFARLGTLPGQSKEEILAAVGPVTSFSAAGAGKTVL